MADSTKRINYSPVMIFGLTMALGPLAALSLGSRYADEETLARANAGRDNYTPTTSLAAYGPSGSAAAVPEYARDKNVVDILAGSGVFGTFAQAIAAAGLSDRLSGLEGYTLFVPSEEAFTKMANSDRAALLNDRNKLSAFLDEHMIPGRFTATDLMTMGQATTKAGTTVDVGPSARYDGHVGVGGAEVIKTNLFAANGIVHVVDRVIQ